MFKLMPGNKTSPHVQIFMKLMLHLPPWKSVQSRATIDHSWEHAAMLKVLSLMHPGGAHSDERFRRVARHRRVSLRVQRESLTMRKSVIVLFSSPFRKIIFVFRENSRNHASCEQARIQLAEKVVHG